MSRAYNKRYNYMLFLFVLYFHVSSNLQDFQYMNKDQNTENSNFCETINEDVENWCEEQT